MQPGVSKVGAAVILTLFATSCVGNDFEADPFVELRPFYQELEHEALAFPRAEGAWLEHYGDAPFWGTAFYARVGAERGDAELQNIAEQARDYDVTVIEHANRDPLGFAVDNLEEVMMAALGLIEHHAVTGDGSYLDVLDALIDLMNGLAQVYDDYLEVSLGEFALDTYGATAMSGAVALINLQYAQSVVGEGSQERLRRAVEIVESIDEKAFDGARYRFSSKTDALYLYPNSIMMLVNARLFQVTGERRYLDRAELVFDGIQPLKHLGRGGYRSPYSAEYMGARTDDYTTLSSQNYLALALLAVYEGSGDPRFLDEARALMAFVRDRLYDPEQGRILHHFIDGHIAQPGDREYWCSGCNLQTLYVLWYLEGVVRRLHLD